MDAVLIFYVFILSIYVIKCIVIKLIYDFFILYISHSTLIFD